MLALLKQPLLHFFLLGAALFALFELVGGEDGGQEQTQQGGEIVVTAGRIDSLAQQFTKAWQRPPSAEELRALIDEFVRDEVMYREALAMALDRDDTIVRRRMRQKLEFLVEDTAALAEPTDEQLQAYLSANADSFRRQPVFSFVQIYINADGRGAKAESEARALLTMLQGSGAEVDLALLGDPLVLGQTFESRPAGEVEQLFGEAFTKLVDEAELDQWRGPVASAYGLHLIRVHGRVEGRLPELAEVRDAVAREWAAHERRALSDAAYERLRAKYTVTIEAEARRGAPP